MKKKMFSSLLISFTLLGVTDLPSASAESLKCLTRPAIQASLIASKATLEGLQKSLPKQLELANKIKSQLPAALEAMKSSYAIYKQNPTPENKKSYDKKNLTYQSLNASYNLQYDLYLGQKRRLPTLIVEVEKLKAKLSTLSKECAKP